MYLLWLCFYAYCEICSLQILVLGCLEVLSLWSLSRLVPSLDWAFSLNWAGAKNKHPPFHQKVLLRYGDNSSNVPGTPNRKQPPFPWLPIQPGLLMGVVWEVYPLLGAPGISLMGSIEVSTSAKPRFVSHNAESKFTQNETKKDMWHPYRISY